MNDPETTGFSSPVVGEQNSSTAHRTSLDVDLPAGGSLSPGMSFACRVASAAVLLLCSGVAILSGRSFSPEAGRPQVTNYTASTYRGHNQMWATVQAPDGLLYFGNRARVFEFDGQTWRSLKVPGTFVRRLALTSDGRIFLGSTDEFGFLARARDGAMTYTSLRSALPPGADPLGPVLGLVAADDAVFLSTPSRVLRWSGGAFTLLPFSDAARPALTRIGAEVFLHRPAHGLFRLQDGTFQSYADAPFLRTGEAVLLVPGDSAALLAILADSSMYQLSNNGQWTPWVPGAAAFLGQHRWRHALRLADGNLALSSETSGVVVLSPEGVVVQRANEANGLENQLVLGLFQDREGSVWVNTNNGTARVEFASPYTLFDRLNGPGRDFVRQFCRHDGVLYAVNGSGIYRLVPGRPDGSTAARFERLTALADESGWGLASHRTGLLVGTGRGIVRVQGDETEVLLTTNDPVSCLVPSRDDPDLFFAGRGLGLNVLRYVDGAWRDLGALPDFSADVRSIVEDPNGSLWLGTSTRGITRLVRASSGDWLTGSVTTYLETHGLPANQGWTMVYATPGGPVFVPRAGVYRFHRDTGTFRPDLALCPEGKVDATAGTITSAPDGTLWLQSQVGEGENTLRVNSLVPDGRGGYDWRTEPRKLQEMIGWGGARTVWWDRNSAGDESVWISGAEATVRIDASRRPALLPPYDALIRTVQFPGQSPQAAPADGQGPEVPFARDSLVFTFAATRFASGAAHEFQTRLLGYEDTWSPWSTKTEASFTNLMGGPFTFEVRARDVDGEVSRPARYTFAVTPPWPQRRAAWFLYSLLGCGLVAGYVRWRLRRGERERARLEGVVAERTEELRLARDAADEANRAKSAFLANMSHELRTPLNGVLGYAQVLQKSPRLAETDRARVHVMQGCGEHLLRLINEVLDLSKIEAGKLELVTAPFHLPQLLRDIVSLHAGRAQQKQLALKLAGGESLPDLVLGDAQKLRQVLDNLVANAIKFTLQGSVTLSVRLESSDTFAFAVTDTGVGIAVTDQARLFEPFQQAAEGRPAESGTGLGLAIARRLVALQGGTLAFASTPGSGSRFHFTLPLPVLGSTVAAEPRGPAVGYRGPRRRILVVDDVAVNRAVVLELLNPLGFELREAPDAEAALAAASTWTPDAVLLDLRMPRVDGGSLARALRRSSQGARLKLIAMSASVLGFSRDEAFAAGCDDFLPKPFRETDLIALLERTLRLEWTFAAPPSPAPAAAAGVELTPERLAELLALSRRGELGPLRAHLAELRSGPLVEALREAARNYQMDRLRTLLEQQSATPRPGA